MYVDYNPRECPLSEVTEAGNPGDHGTGGAAWLDTNNINNTLTHGVVASSVQESLFLLHHSYLNCTCNHFKYCVIVSQYWNKNFAIGHWSDIIIQLQRADNKYLIRT